MESVESGVSRVVRDNGNVEGNTSVLRGGLGVRKETALGKRVSFRDKVLEGKVAPQQGFESDGDLLDLNLVSLKFDEGNRRRPMVQFSEQAMDILSAPWRDPLVIKLLGKRCSFSMMKEKFAYYGD